MLPNPNYGPCTAALTVAPFVIRGMWVIPGYVDMAGLAVSLVHPSFVRPAALLQEPAKLAEWPVPTRADFACFGSVIMFWVGHYVMGRSLCVGCMVVAIIS